MKKKITLFMLSACLLLSHGCEQYDHQRFIEYLKAERALRSSVSDQSTLDAKIRELQEEFRIDPKKEIARFRNHEKHWVRLLTDLSRAR